MLRKLSNSRKFSNIIRFLVILKRYPTNIMNAKICMNGCVDVCSQTWYTGSLKPGLTHRIVFFWVTFDMLRVEPRATASIKVFENYLNFLCSSSDFLRLGNMMMI